MTKRWSLAGTDTTRRFSKESVFRFAQKRSLHYFKTAGWSSLVARQAHNLKAAGSNPAPATKSIAQIWKRTCRS